MAEQVSDNRMLTISERDAFSIYLSLDNGQYPDAMPRNLQIEELNSLGLTIAGIAERINPSRDGFKNGRSAERNAVGHIAVLSRCHGDMETSLNALEHLETLVLRGKLSASLIKFAFKNKTNS